MGTITYKKVAKKKLFGMTQEALDALKSMTGHGKNETDALHDALIGLRKFNPPVERAISAYQAEHDLPRERAIEAMLVEYLQTVSLPKQKESPSR